MAVALASIPLLALLGVWFSFEKHPGTFPLDDAYVHLVYARNLSETGLLAFNPGEPSLGSSSPLWVFLLALCHRAGLDLWHAALGLSLLAFCGIVVLAVDLTARAGRSLGLDEKEAAVSSWGAGLLLALNGNLHWLALSGMETLAYLFLSLLVIRLYLTSGFGAATGVAAGALALARLPGGLLGLLLALLDIARRRRLPIRGALAMALPLAPYLAVAWWIGGSLLPTPAAGKLLTYVESGADPGQIFWYVVAFAVYQKFLPQQIVLCVGLAVLAGLLVKACRKSGPRELAARLEKTLPAGVLALWGAAHFTLHALAFRIVGHHQARYLADEFVLVSLLGPLGIVLAASRLRSSTARAGAAGMLLVALLLAGRNLTQWRTTHERSLRLIESVHLPAALWIREKTPPSARVASFDVGVLGWSGGRNVVDLGGLVDPAIHPFLRARACGEYLRKRGVDTLITLRNQDTEEMTGVFRSFSKGDPLLRLELLTSFSIDPLPMPGMTQSFGLEIFHVEGWYPRTPAGIARLLDAAGESVEVPGGDVDERLRFTGATLRPRDSTLLSVAGTTLEINLIFEARLPLLERYFVRGELLDVGTGRSAQLFEREAAAGLFRPGEWPVGRPIRDPLLAFVPPGWSAGTSRLLLSVGTCPERAELGFPLGATFDLGRIELRQAAAAPVSHGALREAFRSWQADARLRVLSRAPGRIGAEGLR